MYKAISLLVISAVLLTFTLCSCNINVAEEETTDNSESVMAAIDKSSPITSGNLITKTNTDDNGNININYYDSKGNLVENFVWSDDENVEHTLMKYSESNLLLQKEEIAPDGKKNFVESYQYDKDNKIQQKTVSEFEDGKLKISTAYNAKNEKTSHSISFYNDTDKLSKVERYDENDSLEEYYMYEYNDDGKTVKYSAFDAEGNLKKYTTFDYNDNGQLSIERYFSNDNKLENYYKFEYFENGDMKSSSYYDSEGNLLSEDFFEQTTN